MADNFEDDDDLECKVDVAKPSVDRSKSALQANIEEKGKNAYYYAWKKDSLNNDPNAIPMKVGEEEILFPTKTYLPIQKYSFCDELNKVTVYVPLENIESIAKEQVSVQFTSTSFDLIVSDFCGKDHRLAVLGLHSEINVDTSKFLIRSGKIVVLLKKLKEESWGSLKSEAK